MPVWVARIVYAERFGVEPHTVNPPLRWWLRVNAFDAAKAKRQAREAVEQVGLSKVSPDHKRLYNELILELRNGR